MLLEQIVWGQGDHEWKAGRPTIPVVVVCRSLLNSFSGVTALQRQRLPPGAASHDIRRIPHGPEPVKEIRPLAVRSRFVAEGMPFLIYYIRDGWGRRRDDRLSRYPLCQCHTYMVVWNLSISDPGGHGHLQNRRPRHRRCSL